MKTDKEIINALGGAAKVAALLGFSKKDGTKRVYNWLKRGIPAKVKLTFPQYFISIDLNEKP